MLPIVLLCYIETHFRVRMRQGRGLGSSHPRPVVQGRDVISMTQKSG